MGFDPALVGLPGPITGRFEEPRDGCFHPGIDISSSAVSKPFQAGIFGRVVPPSSSASKWCTIAIQPFHDLAATVQYLHANAVYVSVGDFVAPWTVLGVTGNCSPTTVPIHLHLQVAYQTTPKHDCWDRDFVNPETWGTASPLLGVWTDSDDGQNYKSTTNIRIISDNRSGLIGSISSRVQWTWRDDLGRNCEADTSLDFDLICTGIEQKNIMNVQCRFVSGRVLSSTCPFQVSGANADAKLTLDSASRLTLNGVSEYVKTSGLSETDRLEESAEPYISEGTLFSGSISGLAIRAEAAGRAR